MPSIAEVLSFPMKLARLRQLSPGLPILQVDRDFLFASTMLVHLERLPQVAVLAKQSSAISDSFEACFEYRGYRFAMEIPFGCIMIAAQDAKTPRELLDELAKHIDSYRTVWPIQLLWAFARYFVLPFKAQPSQAA